MAQCLTGPPNNGLHQAGVSPTRPCRQFTVAYKRQILEAAAQCTQAGQPSAPNPSSSFTMQVSHLLGFARPPSDAPTEPA